MCCVVAVLTLVVLFCCLLFCLFVVGCGRGCVGYRWGLRLLGCERRRGFFVLGRCCDAVSPMCCDVAVLTLVIVVSFVVCLLVCCRVSLFGTSRAVSRTFETLERSPPSIVPSRGIRPM